MKKQFIGGRRITLEEAYKDLGDPATWRIETRKTEAEFRRKPKTMSEQKSRNYSTGVGFSGLLTIVFITLKLCGVINWSWWLVLLPSLLNLGFILAVLLFALVCYLATCILLTTWIKRK